MCVMSSYHMLHADGDLVVNPKVAKEPNDVRRVALVQDLEFSHNLVTYRRFDIQHNHLVWRGRRGEGKIKVRPVKTQVNNTFHFKGSHSDSKVVF